MNVSHDFLVHDQKLYTIIRSICEISEWTLACDTNVFNVCQCIMIPIRYAPLMP